ncbi:hypothetical protein [Streptomyces sp. URMC 123]|uniref:hypothetical protein n=1 Tax=Streptomyces sp. URMC 123 TaxID=3423403 RepID=UPI003F1CE673
MIFGDLPICTEPQRWMREQHGVVTREQLARVGVPQSTAGHRARPDGPWQRPLPRVYVLHSAPLTWQQRLQSALLYSRGMLTGPAALALYRLRHALDRHTLTTVDVLTADDSGVRDAGFVRVHRTRRLPAPRRVEGFACAPLPRALADAVRGRADAGHNRALLLEAVRSRRVGPDELRRTLAGVRASRCPGVAEVQAEISAGLRSVATGRARQLLRAHGVREPLWSPRLLTAEGELAAVPDAYWPHAGVVWDIDAREWHLTDEAREAELERRARLAELGLTVLTITPDALRDDREEVVRALRDALSRGAAGTPPWFRVEQSGAGGPGEFGRSGK